MPTISPITPRLKKRFWNHVAIGKPDECWLWKGYIGRRFGYADYIFKQNEERPRACVRAHRLAWILTKGQVPDGLCVLHRCDVRHCCNPAHLFLGTKADNNRDKVEKGRQPRGESHPSAKVREADITEIRRMRGAGLTQQAIADHFGVIQATISKILLGRTWKCLNHA